MGYLWPIVDGPAPTGASRYGEPRGDNGKHAGCDIAGTAGTPVLSPVDGVVIRVVSERLPGQAWDVGPSPLRDWVSGNGVIVKATNGLYVLVNHVAPAVHPGQRITRGTVLGHLDRSGIQTGPHLHIEFHRGYPTGLTHFDPMTLLDPKETDMQLLDTFPIPKWVRNQTGITDTEMTVQRGLMYSVIAGSAAMQNAVQAGVKAAVKEALADASLTSVDPDQIAASVVQALGKALS